MFTNMVPLKEVIHNARNSDYKIRVFKVIESNKYKIFASKNGSAVVFPATKEIPHNLKTTDSNIVEDLVSTAINKINRNEFVIY